MEARAREVTVARHDSQARALEQVRDFAGQEEALSDRDLVLGPALARQIPVTHVQALLGPAHTRALEHVPGAPGMAERDDWFVIVREGLRAAEVKGLGIPDVQDEHPSRRER